MDIEQLKYNLKSMIIQECEKEDISPEDIADDVELFSDKSGLELDSLDALQISMGLQNKFGIRLVDSKDFRRVVTTIDNLVAYINEQNA
ncbi:MAG: phosphopantetheine-binding protein [Sulfurimonas sp.]|uniref:phosphopantetheine-binding protein n=1 Tax=Sulfurimonas sp. TaxID=2022749 RepID=UPI0025DA7DCC|nr:phosphopantetheine-binding protein [Sulfurimonas sp.]MCK9492017.1 phosphopantetheine-binding protein [Sulfurimonas sp.]